MANSLFDSGRDAFARGSLPNGWLGGTVVPYFMGSFHPGLVASGVFLSDIPVAVYRARGTYLANKTATAGIVDADDTSIVPASNAATVLALIHIVEAGNPVSSAVSLLLHNVDTASVFPFNPIGGEVQIVYPPVSSSGVFKL